MITKDFFEVELPSQVDEMGGTPTVTLFSIMGESYNICRVIKLSETFGIFEVYPAGGTTQREKDRRKPIDKVIWDRIVVPYQQIARVSLSVQDNSGGFGFVTS